MEAWKEKFVSWFATSGRMNRAAFVKRFFGVNLVCMAAVLVIGSRVIEETGSVFALNLVSGVLAALAAVFLYSPMVRRLHDIGRDARLAQAYLCFGIPQGFLLGKVAALPPGSLGLYAFEAALAAVTLLFIVLVFHAGEPRRNAYGAVPGRAAAAQQTGRKKGRRLKKAGTV